MKSKEFDLARDGFYGNYYDFGGDTSFIYMLGPSIKGPFVTMGLKYFKKFKINVMVTASTTKDGYYMVEINHFKKMIDYLESIGNKKIGIAGGSATACIALVVASYCPKISLTVAITPCDFVMEGYTRLKLDKTKEQPASKSLIAVDQVALPYLPYAYRHPDYWNKVMEESKLSGNKISTIKMFELSEEEHPLTEEEFIKVENIRGTLVLAGGKDDSLWNTAKYINRMKERVSDTKLDLKIFLYDHATHFIFPESMLRSILGPLSSTLVSIMFKDGKKYKKECKASRIDFDKNLEEILKNFSFHK